jgi:hypothetical protein
VKTVVMNPDERIYEGLHNVLVWQPNFSPTKKICVKINCFM